jgi:WD40 repeat protein
MASETSGVRRTSRRRVLLGASALPAALLLPGCGRLPFLGPEPGSCLSPEEELPEFDDGGRGIPAGGRGRLHQPSPSRWFNDAGLAVSPDGALIAAAEHPDRSQLDLADSYGVVLWDTAEGKVLRRIPGPAAGAIAWHPDGALLAIADTRHIAIVDVVGELRWNLIGHGKPRDTAARIMGLAFSPDGTQLASTSTDGTVRLWDMDGDRCGAGHILQPDSPAPATLAYLSDGSALVVGGTSPHGRDDPPNGIEHWDPATGERLEVPDDGERILVDFGLGADDSRVEVTYAPETLEVITADGERSSGPEPPDTTHAARLAVGSGSRVALQAPGELLVWDRDTGEETRFEDQYLQRICWSPDESVLYTLEEAEGVAAWDGESWRGFELP